MININTQEDENEMRVLRQNQGPQKSAEDVTA